MIVALTSLLKVQSSKELCVWKATPVLDCFKCSVLGFGSQDKLNLQAQCPLTRETSNSPWKTCLPRHEMKYTISLSLNTSE